MRNKRLILVFLIIFCITITTITFISCKKKDDLNKDNIKWSSKGLEYDLETGTVIGYSGTAENVAIPEKVNGVKITTIGERVFRENYTVKKVKLSNNITTLKSYAFDSYTINEIIFSKSVRVIEDHALRASFLREVEFNEGLISIGESVFSKMCLVNKITIPSTVQEIGCDAFYTEMRTIVEVYNKSTINLREKYEDYNYYGLDNVLNIYTPSSGSSKIKQKNNFEIFDDGYNKIVLRALKDLETMTIPNGIEKISPFAFFDFVKPNFDDEIVEPNKLKKIVIPDSVTSIGEYAFIGCGNLKSITIPSSVTSIGYCAFNECSSLTSIVVDINNTVYDSRNNCNAIIETITNTLVVGCQSTTIPSTVTSIGEDAFSGCSSLTSVTIPYGVTTIGSRAFRFCSNLTSINIPDSVTSIGWYTFYGCSSLTSITIPSSVESIEDGSFEECSNLTKIVFLGTKQEWYSFGINLDYMDCIIECSDGYINY